MEFALLIIGSIITLIVIPFAVAIGSMLYFPKLQRSMEARSAKANANRKRTSEKQLIQIASIVRHPLYRDVYFSRLNSLFIIMAMLCTFAAVWSAMLFQTAITAEQFNKLSPAFVGACGMYAVLLAASIIFLNAIRQSTKVASGVLNIRALEAAFIREHGQLPARYRKIIPALPAKPEDLQG